MAHFGTVRNGVVVLDPGVSWPEGYRLLLVDPAEEEEDWGDALPPPRGETREEILESLRQSFRDKEAGLGRPAKEVFAEIRAELGLPPSPGEIL
jgi:hypothetical protein